jgi:hypothetical protein
MSEVRVNIDGSDVVVSLATAGPQGPRGSQLLSGASDPSSVIGLIGDHYVATNSGKLFGPKTSSGWGEGVFIGVNDPSNIGQAFIQLSPSTQWDISHTLQFVPNIVVVDPEGEVVEGLYEYLDDNNIRATFSNPISGKAYLS